jgi:hypothetical protein
MRPRTDSPAGNLLNLVSPEGLRRACLLGWLLAFSSPSFAQEGPRSINLPNPMNIHTWFIIGAVGAFLAWCISYTIQSHKEALARQTGKGDLHGQREEILNRIADLENRKDSAQISDQRYKHEMRELRFRLGRILQKIANPEAQLPRNDAAVKH